MIEFDWMGKVVIRALLANPIIVQYFIFKVTVGIYTFFFIFLILYGLVRAFITFSILVKKFNLSTDLIVTTTVGVLVLILFAIFF